MHDMYLHTYILSHCSEMLIYASALTKIVFFLDRYTHVLIEHKQCANIYMYWPEISNTFMNNNAEYL